MVNVNKKKITPKRQKGKAQNEGRNTDAFFSHPGLLIKRALKIFKTGKPVPFSRPRSPGISRRIHGGPVPKSGAGRKQKR
jgi:hypothetical protein